MITIQHDTTRYTVTEANAAKIRAILDSGKLPKIKNKVDRRHDATRRDYPAFYPGMTTADYLEQFQRLNSRLELTALIFDHADRAAPMLDATQPEALEEADPDYTAPITPVKPRKATPAQLLARIDELQNALRAVLYAHQKGHDLDNLIDELERLAK